MSSTQKNDETSKAEGAGAEQGATAGAGKEGKDWASELKKFADAAIGSFNRSQDDVKTFVKKLVEKGEIAKKDGEKIVKQFAEKVQQTVKRDAKTAVTKAEEAVEAATEKATAAINQEKLAERIHASIERMLHTMNIATRKDVEELGKQLDELDRKVEQLVEAATSAAGVRGGRKASAVPSASGTGA